MKKVAVFAGVLSIIGAVSCAPDGPRSELEPVHSASQGLITWQGLRLVQPGGARASSVVNLDPSGFGGAPAGVDQRMVALVTDSAPESVKWFDSNLGTFGNWGSPCSLIDIEAAQHWEGLSDKETCVIATCNNHELRYGCGDSLWGSWLQWTQMATVVDAALSVVDDPWGFTFWGIGWTNKKLVFGPLKGGKTLASQPPVEPVSVAANGFGHATEVAVLGIDGSVWNATYDHSNGSWTAWGRVGSQTDIFRNKLAMTRVQDELHLFATGTGSQGNQIMHAYKSGTWQPWEPSPGVPVHPVTGGPIYEPIVDAATFDGSRVWVAARWQYQRIREAFLAEWSYASR